tara:strand:+ start:172919 stop:173053 length:135 start_codon:yes stop_codon:yes gene_type:complete
MKLSIKQKGARHLLELHGITSVAPKAPKGSQALKKRALWEECPQ